MILHSVYPDDIKADRQYAASIDPDTDDRRKRGDRADALFVADLIETLEGRDGPTKWFRLNHDTTLTFLQYSPDVRQKPQLFAYCHRRVSEVRYAMPFECSPWEWAMAYAWGLDATADLIMDAWQKCESREEYLVEKPA